MNVFTQQDLRELAELDGEYVVSIYMPACVGVDSRQNQIRFRNLIRAAGEKMLAKNIGRPAIQKMSVTARELLDQSEPWTHLSHGLAVFVTRGVVQAIPLPFACDEVCIVDRHTHLLPLVTWAANDEPYFLLAVSQNAVRLFHGTRAELEQLDVPGLPANRGEALHYDPRQGTLQAHTGQPQFPGKEGVVFHGQGGEVDVAKEEITAYFREIDRAVCNRLRDHAEPLVFAGVDYLFPLYRAVNCYANLAASAVAGNPDLLTPAELCQRAWYMMETSLYTRSQTAANNYWDSVTHGLTANDLEQVLAAAHAGAIETLFVAPTARFLGKFDARTSAIRHDANPLPDSQDLVNLAVTLALRTRAGIEVVASGNIPGGGVLAAVLRYPFIAPRAANMHANGRA